MGSLLVAFTSGMASGQTAEIMSASATALVSGVKSTFLVATAIVGVGIIAALFELKQHVVGGKKNSR